MVFPPDVTKGSIAQVALDKGIWMMVGQVLSQSRRVLEYNPTDVALERPVGIGNTILIGIPVYLEMLLQLQGLDKGLAADFASWADLTSVFAHVVQQVLFLAKNVAADVAFVLDLSGVDGDVFPEAVEAGKFPGADLADEETVAVLNSILNIVRDRICEVKKKIRTSFSFSAKERTRVFYYGKVSGLTVYFVRTGSRW